jgi:hypothetical protein
MENTQRKETVSSPLYFSAQISQFDGIRPEPLSVCPTIEQVIDYIKADQRLKTDVDAARKYLKTEIENDERDRSGKLLLPEYDEAKKGLPAVTWAGTFSKRTNTGLVAFSGFLSFDIDFIDKRAKTPVKYDEMRDKARQAYKLFSRDRYTSLVFPSVSATGVKGLIKIPPVLSDAEYKAYFRAYKMYASQTLRQVLDALPDISRLCFLSPCKTPYVNRESLLFDQRQDSQEELSSDTRDARADASAQAAIAVFMRHGIQRELPRNSFVGVCGVFKRSGVGYDVFDSIMKKTPGYDAKNNFKIWNTVQIATAINNPMTIATLISWAREQDKELFRAVRKEAKKKEETGVEEEGGIGLAELIEKKLSAVYSFKLNEVTDQTLVTTQTETRQMSKFVESEIRCWLTDQGFSRRDTISDVLNVVAYRGAFNPIQEYLHSLAWDGECHFSEIDKYFKDPDRIFSRILKSWMCGAVRRVETGQHHPCIIFVGKQGTGKSSFAKWLCSKLPKYFLEKPIAPDTNDAQIRVSENFIWEIGEIGSTTRRADIDALKLFISLEEAVFRRAHDKYDQHKKCIASFLGTVNPDGTGFLNDPTGHRRWWPVEVTHIDFAYSSEMNVDQLWAQAVMLWRESDLECEVAEDVQKTINLNIENDFAMADPVEDLILKLFDFTGGDSDFMDINDILVFMARNGYQRNKQRADAMEVARAMKKIQDCGKEVHKHRDSQRRGYSGIRVRSMYTGDKWA